MTGQLFGTGDSVVIRGLRVVRQNIQCSHATPFGRMTQGVRCATKSRQSPWVPFVFEAPRITALLWRFVWPNTISPRHQSRTILPTCAWDGTRAPSTNSTSSNRRTARARLYAFALSCGCALRVPGTGLGSRTVFRPGRFKRPASAISPPRPIIWTKQHPTTPQKTKRTRQHQTSWFKPRKCAFLILHRPLKSTESKHSCHPVQPVRRSVTRCSRVLCAFRAH